jgi:hypothetical protein
MLAVGALYWLICIVLLYREVVVKPKGLYLTIKA